MAENAFTKLPAQQRLLISVLVPVVLAGLVFYFLWPPYPARQADLEAKTAEHNQLENQIRELNVIKANLPLLEKEVQDLTLRLDQLKRILPPAKETPDLMKRLQALATQSNLKLKGFRPGATTQRDFYLEWPIEIQVDGTYHNLAVFFDRVGRLPRIVNIGNLKANAPQRTTASQTLQASFTATTYVYAPQPQAAVKK